MYPPRDEDIIALAVVFRKGESGCSDWDIPIWIVSLRLGALSVMADSPAMVEGEQQYVEGA